MTDHPSTPHVSDHGSTHAPQLRRRADHLAELACSIERSLVMTFLGEAPDTATADRRAQLGDALLERNLHQLHRAADDLRITAMHFRSRADELDAAHRVAA